MLQGRYRRVHGSSGGNSFALAQSGCCQEGCSWISAHQYYSFCLLCVSLARRRSTKLNTDSKSPTSKCKRTCRKAIASIFKKASIYYWPQLPVCSLIPKLSLLISKGSPPGASILELMGSRVVNTMWFTCKHYRCEYSLLSVALKD